MSSSLNLVDENGVLARRFFRLKLERDEIVFFPTSWTIVHPIDENSPFYGMTEEEFRASEPELLILIQGYDDSYFANIQVRYSYIEENTVWGGKWRKILQVAEDGSSEIHLNHFNDFDRVEINSLIPDKSMREIAD